MKKKLLAMALCVCTAFSIAACGGDDTNGNATENTSGEKTEAKITLGKYMGIEVDSSLKSVSEEDVQDYLQLVLENNATYEEVKEGTLEKGDVMKISYVSTVDGEEYKSAEGYEIDTTRGFEVDGFIDGLMGHNIGEEVSLDLTLPEDFSETDYAGKAIHFDVTIEAKINTIIPEFTDEFVASTFDYIGCSTTEEFLEYLEKDIYINNIYGEIWGEVVESATIESYDSEGLEETVDKLVDFQEMYITTNYGIDLATYLSAMGQTEEQMRESLTESAKSYLDQKMLVEAIAEAEGIEVTEAEYNQTMLEFAKADGYDTVEELVKAYETSMTEEDFRISVLSYIVEEYVCENVTFVDGLGLRSDAEAEEDGTTEGNAS